MVRLQYLEQIQDKRCNSRAHGGIVFVSPYVVAITIAMDCAPWNETTDLLIKVVRKGVAKLLEHNACATLSHIHSIPLHEMTRSIAAEPFCLGERILNQIACHVGGNDNAPTFSSQARKQ